MELDHYLIVDDEKPIAQMLVEFFHHRKGISATHVQSPQQALDFMQLTVPKLVISDYHMPGMTGMALYKEARNRGYNMPFVFMSGNIFDSRLQNEATLLGISLTDILLKPFTFPELDAKVEKALAMGAYRLGKASTDQSS